MITVKPKVRVKINTRHVQKRYKAGRDKALERVGANMRRQAKKEFSSRVPSKKPQWRRIGERDGTPILEVSFREPRPGKVTSWKTRRNPGGFLKSAIEYRTDQGNGSVVIGPMPRARWLNKIQEFGGSAPVEWRMLTRRPTDKLQNGLAVPRGLGRGGGVGGRDASGRFLKGFGGVAYIVQRVDPAHTRRRGAAVKRASQRVKKGRYMGGALDKQRPRIPKAFQNTISGP